MPIIGGSGAHYRGGRCEVVIHILDARFLIYFASHDLASGIRLALRHGVSVLRIHIHLAGVQHPLRQLHHVPQRLGRAWQIPVTTLSAGPRCNPRFLSYMASRDVAVNLSQTLLHPRMSR